MDCRWLQPGVFDCQRCSSLSLSLSLCVCVCVETDSLLLHVYRPPETIQMDTLRLQEMLYTAMAMEAVRHGNSQRRTDLEPVQSVVVR